MSLLQSICSFLAWALGIYSTIILIRIILSWIVLFNRKNSWGSGSGNGWQNFVANADSILGKICDPYLKTFQGVKSLRRANLDLSPLLALCILNFARTVLSLFANSVSLSIWIILAILIEGLWSSLFSFLLIALIILLVIRLILGKGNSAGTNNWINTIDSILNPSVGRVYKLFFKNNKQVDEQKVVIAAIIFYAVVLVVSRGVVGFVVNFLISL